MMKINIIRQTFFFLFQRCWVNVSHWVANVTKEFSLLLCSSPVWSLFLAELQSHNLQNFKKHFRTPHSHKHLPHCQNTSLSLFEKKNTPLFVLKSCPELSAWKKIIISHSPSYIAVPLLITVLRRSPQNFYWYTRNMESNKMKNLPANMSYFWHGCLTACFHDLRKRKQSIVSSKHLSPSAPDMFKYCWSVINSL